MTTRTVTVHLRAEVASYLSGQLKAQHATKDTRQEIERLEMAASGLTKAGLVSAIAGIPGALAPAGAAVAALPGMVLGAAASFGVLALATNGVGDAMKAVAEGDADKLREALAELSDEAKAFVGEYARVKPILDELGDATQNAFFSQLRGDLEVLTGAYLPTMQIQLPRLATALGELTSDFGEMAASPATVAAVNRQIELATDVTADWSRLLRTGTGILLDLADAGIDFNKGFAAGLADGAEGLRRWIGTAQATGQMNDMFENGSRILDKLGDIAAETGDLLFDMMANPALADATVALLDLLGMTLEIVHGLVNAFGALPGPLQTAAATFLVIGGAAALLVGRIAAMKAALATTVLKLEATGPAGERAARGLEKASKWAGRAAGAYLAMHVAAIALSSFTDAAADSERLTDSLERLGKAGERTGELTRVFGDDLAGMREDLWGNTAWFGDTGRAIESLIPGLREITELTTGGSWSSAKENVQALDQSLVDLVRRGNLDAARAAFTRLFQESGMSLEEFEALLPGYSDAIKDAEAKTSATVIAAAKVSRETKIMSGTLEDAARNAKSLSEVFDQLNGEALDWSAAQDNLEQAIDDASENIVQQKDALKANNEVGRDNRQILRDIAEATRDATQARYTDTNSLGEANKVYEQGRAAFIRTAMAAGATRKAAEELAKQWLLMPPLVQTGISTPGLQTAISRVRELNRQLRLISPKTTMHIGIEGTAFGGVLERWGGITEHAQDGLLKNAATYSPRSPARYAFAEPATGGEAFIPRRGDKARSLGIVDQAARWYGHTIMPTGGGFGSRSPSGGGGSAAGPTTIVVQLIDPQTGAVTRQAQIRDALNRGVPEATVRMAYP